MSSNQERMDILKQRVIKINSVSPTFCIAKWKQSTTTLYNGMTHSCHHPSQHKIQVEDLNKSLTSLHNTPVKIAARKDMLNGIQTKECDYCWNIENLGKDHFSDRHYKSANGGLGQWQSFDEVVASGLGENIFPAYLEVAFENVCNFKCSYCSPDVSSRWLEEVQQHGPYLLEDKHKHHDLEWMKSVGKFPIHHKEYNPYIEKFWEWWPELYEKLDTFRITGGEPLLSDNTWKIIDHVIANPRADFKLSINTNLCVPDKLIKKLCEKINQLNGKIREFIIFTSAESVGEQAEYSRYGMDWQQFTQNVNYFLQNTPQETKLFFMTTVNVFSASTFDKFLYFVSDLRKKYMVSKSQSRVGFSTSYLRWPAHQCLTNLDDEQKKIFTDKMNLCIESLTPDDANVGSLYLEEVEQIKRLLDFMNSRPASLKQQVNFVLFFDEYDKRRGTNVLNVFPELTQMYLTGKENLNSRNNIIE